MYDVNQDDLVRAGLALMIGVAFYAGFYWYQFGQWCIAMWFGTAPPLIIISAAVAAYRLLTVAQILNERKKRNDD